MTEQQRPRPFVTPEKVNKRTVRADCSRTIKCRNCGKKFEKPGDEWGWKVGDKMYVCTYRCMREWEKNHPPKRRGRNYRWEG